MNIKNISIYAFFKPAFDLAQARQLLLSRMQALEVKGTILLGVEGMNCSLSALAAAMDEFLPYLLSTVKLDNPDIKISHSPEIIFKRSLVKIKAHIVPNPGKTPVDMTHDNAPYISPQEFHQWMLENKAMVVLDTRNDYEFKVGRFKNALHLGTKHFSHFENDLGAAPAKWQMMPVVTFCTGGIRCEKAAPLMLKKGFQEVYQLKGGILNYFKTVGKGFFQGECFVFDERIGLHPAGYNDSLVERSFHLKQIKEVYE